MVASLPQETRQSANRQIWTLQTVLASDPAALQQRLAAEPTLTLLAETDVALPQLLDALRRLVAAGACVAVRLQRADEPLLETLAAGHADSVEWAVRAPTSGASRAWTGETQEFEGLRDAITLAGFHGLAVRLRWRVAARTVHALDDLAELSGLARSVTVIALPWLDPTEAPALDAVIAAWPTALRTDVRLMRSGLWPSCLAGMDVEPTTRHERTQAAARHVAACDRCPLRLGPENPNGCSGVPAALLDRPGGPGPDWHAWLRLPSRQHPRAAAHVDLDCVEGRGLALGLRRAWRLFLPLSEMSEFRRAFAARGWHVVAAATVDAGTGGVIRAAEDGDRVLTVVAVTAEDAATCLLEESTNLQRPQPHVLEDQRSRWQDIAESHRKLGALYGYPSCCVEAFVDAHAEIVEHARGADNAIAILRAALRTQYFDARLTSVPGLLGEEAQTPLRHVPCRFDCPQSTALVETLLADLAVHNPAWFAQQQARAAEPMIVFADGTCLSLVARAVSREEVCEVRRVTLRLSQIAADGFAAQVTALSQMDDLTAIRVRPGHGLTLLRSGVWQDWPIPPQSAPRAAEFPILLPFTLDKPRS